MKISFIAMSVSLLAMFIGLTGVASGGSGLISGSQIADHSIGFNDLSAAASRRFAA